MVPAQPEIKSCGFLVVRDQPEKSFLLMRHPDRWDLPKGHMDPGETELETARRELHEETGISADQIEVDPGFRFSHRYPVRLKRHGRRPRQKELVVFLARLVQPVEVVLTEHDDFRWLAWNPPHRIQERTIDPLLEAVARWWSGAAGSPRGPRIYTGVGDQGDTQLLGGRSTRKTDIRIELLGQLDELNAALGLAAAQCPPGGLADRLPELQSRLFDIGAWVAAEGGRSVAGIDPPEPSDIGDLEDSIDAIQSTLPPLTHFILPGGSAAAAALHQARAVCRRCERRWVEYLDATGASPQAGDSQRVQLVWLNRLGDWLFVAARQANQAAGVEETIWKGKQKES